jgi:Contractile injection system tube protein
VPESGQLNRLTILGYKNPACDDTPDDPPLKFEAYVNPTEITLGYEAEYASQSGTGTTPGPLHFNRIKPGDLTVAFFLDGTGANGRKVVVQDQIRQFAVTTGYDGNKHEPRFLKIAWGKLKVFRCKLKSASTVYKLFTANGIPLRAVITAVFTEAVDAQTSEGMAGNQSADLTHVRLVKAGDTLPGLCQSIYGEPRLYLEVARANSLDNFRALQAGTRLRFPPLAK